MSKTHEAEQPLNIIHAKAAGLDIGSREIWACVPPTAEGEQVRVFGADIPHMLGKRKN